MPTPTDEELEILLLEFPEFSCICELCDCGRHKHHKECTKKNRKVKKREWCPITTHQDTFRAFAMRPRSSKRPPPSPQRRHGPMILTTNQRDDFINRGSMERVKPYIPVDEHYEPAKGPFNAKTYYQDEFVPKEHLPEITLLRPPTQGQYNRSAAKFDGRTTNREVFKKWVPKPSLTFGELPSFTGSLLYPEQKGKLPISTAQQSYPGAYAPRQESCDFGPGTLRWEGKMDLMTTNMDTYKGKYAQRAPIIVKRPEFAVVKRGKFMGETQKMRDFPSYKDGMPKRAAMVEPPPETIKMNFDNKKSFDTEQRRMFKGHDPKEHPKPKPYATGPGRYTPPKIKFETQTNQKLDYSAKDLAQAYTKPAAPPPQLVVDKRPRLDDQTMYKVFHKNFDNQPRVRHGDFHETNKYVPPKEKFHISSTTQSTYTPQAFNPVHTYRPEEKPMDNQGKYDFTTVSGDTYKGQPLSMCKAQLFLMQQRLKTEKFKEEELRKIKESMANSTKFQAVV